MDYSKLTKEQLEAKALQVLMIRSAFSTAGFVGGLVYANKTGGHFWRYVGFGILGSMITGLGGFVATMPMTSKILMAKANMPQETAQPQKSLAQEMQEKTDAMNKQNASNSQKVASAPPIRTSLRQESSYAPSSLRM